MTDQVASGSGTGIWKGATAAAALIAVAAGVWGFLQAGKVSALDAELRGANSRLAEVTAALDAAKSGAATAAATANSALQAANARISQSQAALQEASKSDLPVTVTFRRALLGTGLVATFRNISPNGLEVAALFKSPETGLEKRANLVIGANGVQEIGSAEGWPFAPGHTIELTNSKFRPVQKTVPGS